MVTTFITKKRGNVEEGEKFSSLEKEENIWHSTEVHFECQIAVNIEYSVGFVICGFDYSPFTFCIQNLLFVVFSYFPYSIRGFSKENSKIFKIFLFFEINFS